MAKKKIVAKNKNTNNKFYAGLSAAFVVGFLAGVIVYAAMVAPDLGLANDVKNAFVGEEFQAKGLTPLATQFKISYFPCGTGGQQTCLKRVIVNPTTVEYLSSISQSLSWVFVPESVTLPLNVGDTLLKGPFIVLATDKPNGFSFGTTGSGNWALYQVSLNKYWVMNNVTKKYVGIDYITALNKDGQLAKIQVTQGTGALGVPANSTDLSTVQPYAVLTTSPGNANLLFPLKKDCPIGSGQRVYGFESSNSVILNRDGNIYYYVACDGYFQKMEQKILGWAK